MDNGVTNEAESMNQPRSGLGSIRHRQPVHGHNPDLHLPLLDTTPLDSTRWSSSKRAKPFPPRRTSPAQKGIPLPGQESLPSPVPRQTCMQNPSKRQGPRGRQTRIENSERSFSDLSILQARVGCVSLLDSLPDESLMP